MRPADLSSPLGRSQQLPSHAWLPCTSIPTARQCTPCLPQVILGLALGGVVQRGGIVQDNEDRPEVAKPAAS